MSLLTLVRREARASRASWICALLVGALALGTIHALHDRPTAASETALLATGCLLALWSLQFAADSFAPDLSSGRLATTALLPIGVLELWTAKVVFVLMTLVALACWLVGFELGLQHLLGDAGSVSDYLRRLPGLLAWTPAVALLAAGALLTSLLVESALAAMLLALMLVGALVALAYALATGLAMAGVSWTHEQLLVATSIGAAALLAISAATFVRGQRRLGSQPVRQRAAALLLGVLVVAATTAAGGATLGRLRSELGDPLAQIRTATSSPDGRWLALEVARDTADAALPSIWLLDLDSGAHELVSRPGLFERDRLTHAPLPWTTDGAVRLRTWSPWSRHPEQRGVRALPEAEGVRLEQDSSATPRSVLEPDWADLSFETDRESGSSATTVVWRERNVRASFAGRAGRSFVCSPVAGRVLHVADGRVLLRDMPSGADRELAPARGEAEMQPAPDGAAVLVRGDDATRAFSAADGALLHEPWPEDLHVRWIQGGMHHRFVSLHPWKAPAHARILDLESGRSFAIELADLPSPMIQRLGERGFAIQDAERDLVWIDREGRFVQTLVARSPQP